MFMMTNSNVSMTAVHVICMSDGMKYISLYLKLPKKHKQTLPCKNFNGYSGPTSKFPFISIYSKIR